MTICFNNEVIKKQGLTVGEVITLFAMQENIKFGEAITKLKEKGLISTKLDKNFKPVGYFITHSGQDALNTVILDSDTHQESPDRLKHLATQLKSIFPKGKKEGTNVMWTDGEALIIKRLRQFFKKYGNNYADEQILDAAKAYVQGFNSQLKFMQTLRYFIFTERVGVGGEIESQSQLLNFIENAGETAHLKDDWTSSIK